jgi:hypothetical protein
MKLPDYLKRDEIRTAIGYVKDLKPGIWVVCQKVPIEKGGTWEVDMIAVAPDCHKESMRCNRQIDHSYPVFYRPNFISDVIKLFGI